MNQLIPAVLKKVRGVYEQRADVVLAAWPEIIGEQLAKMTKAQSFVDGVLVVIVKNSTLHSLLSRNDKPRILSHIRKKFPATEIKTIIFKMG